MRLLRLKRHWDRLGRRDPFWAALTNPKESRDGWNVEQFFRRGQDEIAAVLQHAAELEIEVPRRRALDFGCGAGRLTQALAGQFDRCDGVDISESMLQTARRYDRFPERCSYHLNTEPDLSLFPDSAFSLVYSTLVLQHMARQYSTTYIQEFVRVRAPDGLLVFQLPSHRTAEEPTSHAESTAISGSLPAAAFRARLTPGVSTLTMNAGEELALPVTVENSSPCDWPALPDGRGRFRVNLGNHWLDDNGAVLERDDARCPLPYDLAPGAHAELMLGIRAPKFNGDYVVEIDMVQEDAGWFAHAGSTSVRIPCRVTSGLAGPHPRRSAPEIAQPTTSEPPFRERHPRVFGLMRATGVRDAYWVWRRAVDRVKGRRDRVIWWLKDHAYEPLKKQTYDATIPRLVNWWRSAPFAPKMEMHCVLRSEVIALLTQAGARVVDVEEELMPGGFRSVRYWVTKQW